MEKLLLKLAAQLLDEYGAILIRNSFNAPSKEVETIVNLFNKEDFNKILADFSSNLPLVRAVFVLSLPKITILGRI